MTDEDKIILDVSLWQERVIKKHTELYNNIIQFSIMSMNSHLKFFQKIYNYYNNIIDIPHCKVCDNPVNFHNKQYNSYCSSVCVSKDSVKKTLMDMYGVNSTFDIHGVREKMKLDNIKKWGFDVPSKSKIIKDKISNTKLSKTDDENDIINKKRVITTLEKWDVDNVAKSDVIKKKTSDNNLEEWGVEYPIQLDYIKEVRRSNYFEKNGVYHHFHIDSILELMQIKRKESLRVNYLDSISHLNLNIVEYDDKSLKIKCDKCDENYDISVYLLYQRYNNDMEICTNCNELNSKISLHEKDVVDFLEKNGVENIKTSNISLIKKELDIYLPDYKLAIEMNGNYWHSELYKDKKYHLDKTNKCNELGIELLHIFQDDWLYKQDIIKSIIKNKINKIDNRIYARKCSIKEVSVGDTRLFLNDNHIQGFSSSKYKIGLYDGDKLVSLMTFGYRMTNSKKEFELIRFCNSLNTNVIGGASKLFKYFINNYEFESIISYADVSMFTGSLYKTLNFEYSHRSKPNYFWVVDGVRKHRFNYNKKKLIKEGFDSNKTEIEIMHSQGYYRIWGCGQDKYIYK